jgi:hypothetical protein
MWCMLIYGIQILCFREKSGRESVIVKLNDEYKTVAVTNVKVRIKSSNFSGYYF